jgi:hypothetical protein
MHDQRPDTRTYNTYLTCVLQWSLDEDPKRTVSITPEAEDAWWKASKRLRLYKKEPELGLSAILQVLATDCNREARPTLPYITRWDGVIVAYIIADDGSTTISGVAPDIDQAGEDTAESTGRRDLEQEVVKHMAKLAKAV